MARRRHVSVITGISGRLGQLLARRLHRLEGEIVLGIDRRAFSRKPADVEHFRIDLRRKAAEDVFRTRRVDVIYHLGVMHDPRKDTGEHHSWNILGTRQILEFAKRYDIPKVVMLSTGDVYGPQSDNPAFIAEDAPLLGAQRFAGMRDLIAVDMFAQSYFWKSPEIETVVLRPAHILGAVRNAVSNYLRLPRVPVLLGFDPMVQVLHEEDVVSALIAAARPGVRGVFNVVGPDALPLRKLVHIAGRPTIEVPHVVLPSVARRLFQFRIADFPAAELDYIRYSATLDGSRLRALTRWHHAFSVEESVAAAQGRGVYDGSQKPAAP
ncbi:MAG: NAD-dependent epimerase/dehydratase family protein [Deltaproteobacteria bacterium]|nr:NAD-dependent epimerase/dehydratase family protein [Deltaproteobacteria bacterium]